MVGDRIHTDPDASRTRPPTASRRTVLTLTGTLSVGLLAVPSSTAVPQNQSEQNADGETAALIVSVPEDASRDAVYTAAATERVLPPADAETSAVETAVLGVVEPGGSETIEYRGQLERALATGPANLSMDAQTTSPDTTVAVDTRARPDEPVDSLENTLAVAPAENHADRTIYAATTSGTITPTVLLGPVTDGTTVLHTLRPHSPETVYYFSGELTSFLIRGSADIHLNGESVTAAEITGEDTSPVPERFREFPHSSETQVAPGTTVHFELQHPDWDEDTTGTSEWWVDDELVGDGRIGVEHDLLFPPDREFFRYTFDERGEYTVEGALLPDDENSRETADTPSDQRVEWTVTVTRDGNQPPQVVPRSPRTPIEISDDEPPLEIYDEDEPLTLEATVSDPDGELARVYWRYRFGDVYLGYSDVTGKQDVARLEEIDIAPYEGGFELVAVNTTGAVTTAYLWDVDSQTFDPHHHVVRPVCERPVQGTETSTDC